MTTFLKIASILLFLTVGKCSFGQMNPKAVATVGGLYSGKILKGTFVVQQGVGGYFKVNAQHWEPLEIYSFKLAVFRDSSLIFQEHNIGKYFSDKIKAMLPTLNSNDEVLIYNIYAVNGSKKEVFLSPLQYIIE
jgi:hypothetical protein